MPSNNPKKATNNGYNGKDDDVFRGMVLAKLENIDKMLTRITDQLDNYQNDYHGHLNDCAHNRSTFMTDVVRNQGLIGANRKEIEELGESIKRFYRTVIVLFTGILLSAIGLFFEKFLFRS